MKRILAVIMILVVMVATLCACGNENWGVGNYTYTHVHASDGAEGHCATIQSWHDNSVGIELHTKEWGSVYLSEGCYILYESASGCPFCGDK